VVRLHGVPEAIVDFVRLLRREGIDGCSDLPSGRPDLFDLEKYARVVWIPEHAQTPQARANLVHQLQPFAAQIGGLVAQARDVSAGPRQAGDQADAHGIADRSHDDGNGLGRPAGSQGGLGARRNDEIDVGLEQLGYLARHSVELPGGVPNLQREVAAFLPSQIPKPPHHCASRRWPSGSLSAYCWSTPIFFIRPACCASAMTATA